MKKFYRKRNRFNVFCAAVLLFGGCANQLEISESLESSQNDAFQNAFKKNLKTLPQTVIDESGRIYLEPNNLMTLLMAGGGSIALHESGADKRAAEHFDKHSILSGFVDESVNILGGPGIHFAATGLWYAVAAENKDEFNKERAWTMIEALSVTGFTTLMLKLINNNHTPNGKSLAWPSGHTSSSFTVASVLDEFYGPEVGIPAYLCAGFVGYRMMDTGDHWASDVLFGGVLGWVVGHNIAGRHKKLEVAGFDVLPYVGSNSTSSTTGLSLVKQF